MPINNTPRAYHFDYLVSLKLEIEKMLNEKTDMQRNYVMVGGSDPIDRFERN